MQEGHERTGTCLSCRRSFLFVLAVKRVGNLLTIRPVQLVEVPVVVIAEAQDDVVEFLVGLFDLAVEGEQQLSAGLGWGMGCHAPRGVLPSR